MKLRFLFQLVLTFNLTLILVWFKNCSFSALQIFSPHLSKAQIKNFTIIFMIFGWNDTEIKYAEFCKNRLETMPVRRNRQTRAEKYEGLWFFQQTHYWDFPKFLCYYLFEICLIQILWSVYFTKRYLSRYFNSKS